MPTIESWRRAKTGIRERIYSKQIGRHERRQGKERLHKCLELLKPRGKVES